MNIIPTREDLRLAYVAHRQQHGIKTTLATLLANAGTDNLDEIEPASYAQVIGALSEGTSIPRGRATMPKATDVYKFWNSAGRRSRSAL
jgi:hypothetical protein